MKFLRNLINAQKNAAKTEKVLDYLARLENGLNRVLETYPGKTQHQRNYDRGWTAGGEFIIRIVRSALLDKEAKEE